MPDRPAGRRGRAVFEVLGAAALFGTTGTSQALGPTGTTPLGVGAARLIIGGVGLMAALPLLGGRPRAAVSLWRTVPGIVGGVCTALYQVCFFAAVSRAGVALGTLVTIGSAPFLAGAMSWLLTRRRPTRTWMLWTLVAVIGLGLLVLDGSARPEVDLLGVLLALGSALGYAAYTVMGRLLIDRGHQSSEVMAASFSLGGLLLIPVLLTQPLLWLTQPSGIVMAVYLGLVTTTVGYILFGRGLTVLDPGPVTTLVLAEPLVATILGVTVLGERLGGPGWIGVIIVLAALVGQGLAEVRRAPAAHHEEVRA